MIARLSLIDFICADKENLMYTILAKLHCFQFEMTPAPRVIGETWCICGVKGWENTFVLDIVLYSLSRKLDEWKKRLFFQVVIHSGEFDERESARLNSVS